MALLCERCGNEPAEYKMTWVLMKEPLLICRFCKIEVEKMFEIEPQSQSEKAARPKD